MLNSTIEIARGLAALWVFLYHVADYVGAGLPWLSPIAAVGHFGVPVFFVISGYCMMALSRRVVQQDESASSFLYWRFMRIFPPFWLSIVVVVLMPPLLAALSSVKSGVFELPPAGWYGFTAWDWFKHVSMLQVFSSTTSDLRGTFNSLNSVYWTLPLEFQFYVVVFVALLFRARRNVILLGVTAAGALAALVPAAYGSGLFLPYWPMFALGIGLNCLLHAGLTPASVFGANENRFAGTLLAALIGASLLAIESGAGVEWYRKSPAATDLGLAVVTAIGFWAAVPAERWVAAARKSGPLPLAALLRALVLLGTISYSLYLLHGKLYQVPWMFVRQILPNDHWLSPVLTIAGTVALVYVFYLVCERPFLRRRRREGRVVHAAARQHPVA